MYYYKYLPDGTLVEATQIDATVITTKILDLEKFNEQIQKFMSLWT